MKPKPPVKTKTKSPVKKAAPVDEFFAKGTTVVRADAQQVVFQAATPLAAETIAREFTLAVRQYARVGS